MNELSILESFSVRPISKEILAVNEFTSEFGLTLTPEEAQEISETRTRALNENERIEMGSGPIVEIIKRFASSRYMTKEAYTYILNELTYIFYYIKTECDDKISDSDLIEELFNRFELQCRGSIDVLISQEAERIIRKINSGDMYYKWYKDRDELDLDSKTGSRITPAEMLGDEFGDGFFASDTLADHDKYEKDSSEENSGKDDIDLDAFDEFLEQSENETYAPVLNLNLANAIIEEENDAEDGKNE